MNLQEVIFSDAESHFGALLEDIKNAKHSINLETYLFRNDILGQRITQALIEAAKRGIRVRVIVDAAGSPRWGTTFAPALEKAGVLTKVFHPLPWQLWNWKHAVLKGPFPTKWLYFILKINSRNHRKVCLIDRYIAYIGSFNIDLRHFRKENGGSNWRDLSVRLSGLPFDTLNKAFNAAWKHRTIKEHVMEIFRHVKRDPFIRLNYTRHHRRLLYKNLLWRISQAKTRIWITNAYFVPDNFLLNRLKEAAQSGIDVRILLPQKSDILIMPWASSTFYEQLLKSGIRIFEYLPGVLHAKSLIIDDWILIGSSNLNHRSLLHDLEADARLSTEAAKEQVLGYFLSDLKASHEISLIDWHVRRPLCQRIIGHLALYLTYWI